MDAVGDVKAICALGDDEGEGEDVSAGDAGVDLGDGCGLVEAIFSGLEATALPDADEVKGVAAADDVGLLKLGGDLQGGAAWGDVDEGIRVRAGGEDEEPGDGEGGDGKRGKAKQESCQTESLFSASISCSARQCWLNPSVVELLREERLEIGRFEGVRRFSSF